MCQNKIFFTTLDASALVNLKNPMNLRCEKKKERICMSTYKQWRVFNEKTFEKSTYVEINTLKVAKVVTSC